MSSRDTADNVVKANRHSWEPDATPRERLEINLYTLLALICLFVGLFSIAPSNIAEAGSAPHLGNTLQGFIPSFIGAGIMLLNAGFVRLRIAVRTRLNP